ncbi:YbaN family protein [Thermoproteota archaeon]
MQQEPRTPNETKASQKLVRVLFFVTGSIFLALGAIGVALPVLPTTPFLLLALACYCRSSERMTYWMLNNKYFGNYIRNYKEGKGIPLKTKLFAITILWITLVYSAIFIIPILIAQVILFGVAVAVTLHLIRLPTYHQ